MIATQQFLVLHPNHVLQLLTNVWCCLHVPHASGHPVQVAEEAAQASERNVNIKSVIALG